MHAETLLKMINMLVFLWNIDYFGEVIPLAGMVIKPELMKAVLLCQNGNHYDSIGSISTDILHEMMETCFYGLTQE